MFCSRTLALIAVLSTAALLLTSCYTIQRGEQLSTETLQRKVDEQSYSVNVRYGEEAEDGVTLDVSRERTYRISYREEYEKIKRRNRTPWLITGLAGLGAGVAGIATHPGCGYAGTPCRTVKEGSASQRATYLLIGGIGATLAGSSGLVWSSMGGKKTLKGNITEGPLTRTETTPPKPVANETVRVRLNGKTQQYTTDDSGTVTIRPIQDFDVSKIGRPRPRVATLVFPETETTKNISLDPKKWTRPYVRITRANQPLRLGPGESVLGKTPGVSHPA